MISNLVLSIAFVTAAQTPEAPAASAGTPAPTAPPAAETEGVPNAAEPAAPAKKVETPAPASTEAPVETEAKVETETGAPSANATTADAAPPTEGFSTAIDDDTPPHLEDFAVASGSLDAPPRATAVVTDDASGVDKVLVYFRAKNAPGFSAVELSPGDGGLFVGSLGEGIQKRGFDYYVEVTDAAGNMTSLGSENRPIFIDPSTVSIGANYETPKPAEYSPPIASYWVAGAFAVGVVAAVVASLAAFEVGRTQLILNSETDFVQGLGILEREDFEETDAELSASTLLYGSVLGIAGLLATVGLSAGTGMLVYNGMSE